MYIPHSIKCVASNRVCPRNIFWNNMCVFAWKGRFRIGVGTSISVAQAAFGARALRTLTITQNCNSQCLSISSNSKDFNYKHTMCCSFSLFCVSILLLLLFRGWYKSHFVPFIIELRLLITFLLWTTHYTLELTNVLFFFFLFFCFAHVKIN